MLPDDQNRHFTRSGHLSELTSDRYRLGELSPDATAAVELHLDTCPTCRAYLDELETFDSRFLESEVVHGLREAAKVVPLTRPATNRRAKMRTALALAAMLLAAAGTTVWWLLPTPDAPSHAPEQDGIRFKGHGPNLEVYVDRPDGSLRVRTGDELHPGDRIGFRVSPREAGHLMIIGVDESRSPYLCYPQGSAGHSEAIDQVRDDGWVLQQAVRFDEVLGHERIIAIYCPDGFTYGELERQLLTHPMSPLDEVPTLREGCSQEEILIVKTPQ